MLTFEQIKELVELVAARRLGGLEIERVGFRLKIDGQAVRPAAAVAALPVGATVEPGGRGAALPAPAIPGAGAVPGAAAAGEPAAGASAAAPAAAAVSGAGGAAEAGPAAERRQPHPGAYVINSPIVGTFYRASSPEAPPFVEVGSRVRKGQVLCIIEAMKLMNDIESDVEGVVLEIYPQNAQAVEFGEPLFAIDRS